MKVNGADPKIGTTQIDTETEALRSATSEDSDRVKTALHTFSVP